MAISSPTISKSKEGGAPPKKADDFQRIDFYGDLIPLLKSKYSVGQGHQSAEANNNGKIKMQN